MQGASMALAFGAYYTIGKRAVAKLDNEDFNAMLKKPELFSQYLNQIGQPIIDNFNYHMKTRTDGIQESILEKAYMLEERKLEENIKLFKYFLRTIFKEGGGLIKMWAQLLGISEEEAKKLVTESGTDVTIINDPTNKDTWQEGYEPPADQDFKPPSKPEETTPTKPAPQKDLHTCAIQYPTYKAKYNGNNYYTVVFDKEIPFQLTGSERNHADKARAMLASVKNVNQLVRETGLMTAGKASQVAHAKGIHAIYEVYWNWYKKHFGYLPTEGELRARGLL